jgi:hypothetical protein
MKASKDGRRRTSVRLQLVFDRIAILGVKENLHDLSPFQLVADTLPNDLRGVNHVFQDRSVYLCTYAT